MSKHKDAADKDEPRAERAPDRSVSIQAAELEEFQQRAAEAEQLREQLLRARADYANLQKRQARAMAEFQKYAVQDFVTALLPALDDLERALQSAADTPDVEALRTGVQMAFDALKKALRDVGIEPVAAVGEPFDPAVHDAVVVETDAGLEVPTVVEEMRAGYRLGERLLRPAQVKVAVPPRPPESDDTSAGNQHPQPSEGGPDADL